MCVHASVCSGLFSQEELFHPETDYKAKFLNFEVSLNTFSFLRHDIVYITPLLKKNEYMHTNVFCKWPTIVSSFNTATAYQSTALLCLRTYSSSSPQVLHRLPPPTCPCRHGNLECSTPFHTSPLMYLPCRFSEHVYMYLRSKDRKQIAHRHLAKLNPANIALGEKFPLQKLPTIRYLHTPMCMLNLSLCVCACVHVKICTSSPFIDYVGLAVGITIAAIVFTIVLPICIIVIVYCCIFGGVIAATRSRNRQPQVVTTAVPAQQAAIVTMTAQQAYPAYSEQQAPPPPYNPNSGYPAYLQQEGGYPQQAYPPQQAYSPQQGGYPPQEKPVDPSGAPYPV